MHPAHTEAVGSSDWLRRQPLQGPSGGAAAAMSQGADGGKSSMSPIGVAGAAAAASVGGPQPSPRESTSTGTPFAAGAAAAAGDAREQAARAPPPPLPLPQAQQGGLRTWLDQMESVHRNERGPVAHMTVPVDQG